jgi:hypothetical protein
MAEQLYFNGIDVSGEYLLPPMELSKFAGALKGQKPDEYAQWLKKRKDAMGPHFGPVEGIDPKDLSQTGWCVIFANRDADKTDKIKEALKPLLDLRREQAGERYREYFGPEGYREGESKNDFTKRHKVGPGPVDPNKIPYYVLIVGDPDAIPYKFQYQLDVQFGVGRIHFDTLDDYWNYANSVVRAEKEGLSLPRTAAFTAVANADDPATNLSSEHLIKPLLKQIMDDKSLSSWGLKHLQGDDVRKDGLKKVLGGADAPALLFHASHGMGFPINHQSQIAHQGAWLLNDWPGPKQWRKPIPPEFYFSGDDVDPGANLWGMIAFAFACYGAGTPKTDEFAKQAFKEKADIAPRSFLAKLPQKMLAHPKGGALAYIGHVERAWGYSFVWGDAGTQIGAFYSTMKRLMEGHPVGSAFEFFNERYSEIASDLTVMMEDIEAGADVDDMSLAAQWTANNDARDYIVMGDPAVRLMVSDKAGQVARPSITLSEAPEGVKGVNYGVGEFIQAAAEKVGLTAAKPAEGAVGESTGEAAPVSGGTVSEGLRKFVDKLGEYLNKALDDATSLEVTTYVADDLGTITYEKGKLTGGARLRAITRINIDGDTIVCLPEKDGEVDTGVWNIHMDMVKQAQASRTELMKTIVSAASNIVNIIPK